MQQGGAIIVRPGQHLIEIAAIGQTR